MNDTIDNLRKNLLKASALNRLIIANVGVFVIIKLIYLFLFLFNAQGFILNWLAVPADLTILLQRPWTAFTYMFLHSEIWHILLNMLWLYWFGQLFMLFLNARQLVLTYILGGFSGALFYIVAFNIFPALQPLVHNSIALGASASVMAIVVAVATYKPNYPLRLMFIGEVKLKYLAIIPLAIDVLSISSENSGGHIAHLGGACFGFFYLLSLRRGTDISLVFAGLGYKFRGLFRSKPKMRVEYKRAKTDEEFNTSKIIDQKKTDAILDKIAKNGYNKLSKEEKEFLFKTSNKK